MTPSDPESRARESAKRLKTLIELLVPTRPLVVQAVERCVIALLADEVRDKIIARVQQLSPEDLATVDALTAELERQGEK